MLLLLLCTGPIVCPASANILQDGTFANATADSDYYWQFSPAFNGSSFHYGPVTPDGGGIQPDINGLGINSAQFGATLEYFDIISQDFNTTASTTYLVNFYFAVESAGQYLPNDFFVFASDLLVQLFPPADEFPMPCFNCTQTDYLFYSLIFNASGSVSTLAFFGSNAASVSLLTNVNVCPIDAAQPLPGLVPPLAAPVAGSG